MGTLGLESVLIGDVVDFVGLAIIGNEAEGSLDSKGLVVGVRVLQLSLSVSRLAIAGLEANTKVQNQLGIFMRTLSVYLRPLKVFGSNIGFQVNNLRFVSQSKSEDCYKDDQEFHVEFGLVWRSRRVRCE